MMKDAGFKIHLQDNVFTSESLNKYTYKDIYKVLKNNLLIRLRPSQPSKHILKDGLFLFKGVAGNYNLYIFVFLHFFASKI